MRHIRYCMINICLQLGFRLNGYHYYRKITELKWLQLSNFSAKCETNSNIQNVYHTLQTVEWELKSPDDGIASDIVDHKWHDLIEGCYSTLAHFNSTCWTKKSTNSENGNRSTQASLLDNRTMFVAKHAGTELEWLSQ